MPVRISYTELDTYLTCPRRYKYRYVLGLEWEQMPAGMAFGRAIGKTLTAYYRSLKEGQILPFEAMLKVFRVTWEAECQSPIITFPEGETPSQLFTQGAAMLEAFYSQAQPGEVIEVEYPFEAPLDDDTTLIGVIDLIEADEEGSFIIVEIKTSKRKPTEEKLVFDLQGAIYSFALKGVTDMKEVLIRYDYLLRQKKAAYEQFFVTKGALEHDRMKTQIKEVLQAINNRSFYPRYGWHCKECSFRLACEKEG